MEECTAGLLFFLMLIMKSFFKRSLQWIRSKKRWALILVLLLWLGATRAAKKFFITKPESSFVSGEHTVATGDIIKSLSLWGTTQFANAQKLTFINKGRVTSVKTKVGAEVKKGDVLATITTDDLDREVEKAKKDLKNKQLDLKKILERSDKELDLLKAQSAYDLLLLKKQTLPSEQQLSLQEAQRLIKDKEKALKEAENDYAELLSGKAGATNAELSLSKNVRNRNNEIMNLIDGLRGKANELQATLDSYDALVKLSDSYTPDQQDIYLGAKNLSAMNSSKNKFWEVKSYVGKLRAGYQRLVVLPLGEVSENQILEEYAILKLLGEDMKVWGKINSSAFADTIETIDWTREKIIGLTKTYGTAYEDKGVAYLNDYTAVVEKLSGLKDSDSTIEDSADKVEKLRIELEKEKLKFNVTQQEQRLAVAELDKEIQDAKINLDKAKDGRAQKETIEAIQNEIDNMQFNLSTLMKKYDEYKIIANFDGVVTKLDMQVGDSIEMNSSSSETQKYIYVETPNLLEVKLEVDQIDIVKIAMGMSVQISVDAFPGEVYSGFFSEIDTMPEGNSYKAKVVFKKNNPEEKILGGMSANVEVILEEERSALVVPNPAIADTEEGEKMVRIKRGDTWIDQKVEVWISDDAFTQILSGLKVGDTIKGLYINESSMKNLGVGEEFETNEGMGMMI